MTRNQYPKATCWGKVKLRSLPRVGPNPQRSWFLRCMVLHPRKPERQEEESLRCRQRGSVEPDRRQSSARMHEVVQVLQWQLSLHKFPRRAIRWPLLASTLNGLLLLNLFWASSESTCCSGRPTKSTLSCRRPELYAQAIAGTPNLQREGPERQLSRRPTQFVHRIGELHRLHHPGRKQLQGMRQRRNRGWERRWELHLDRKVAEKQEVEEGQRGW